MVLYNILDKYFGPLAEDWASGRSEKQQESNHMLSVGCLSGQYIQSEGTDPRSLRPGRASGARPQHLILAYLFTKTLEEHHQVSRPQHLVLAYLFSTCEIPPGRGGPWKTMRNQT